MIKLFQFPSPKDFPNYSPYCVKLETYLKFAEINYQSIATMDMKNSPTKTMPYIQLNGQYLGDTTLIIDHLIAIHGDKVDAWLSKEQKAIGFAIQSMLENHFALFMIYYRWIDPVGKPQFFDRIFAKAPKIIKKLVGDMLSRKMKKTLTGFGGITQFTNAQKLTLAAKDLDAIANYLGNKPYLFGDKPSSYDATLFAVFGTIALTDIETDLKKLTLEYPTLVAHSQGILNKFFTK